LKEQGDGNYQSCLAEESEVIQKVDKNNLKLAKELYRLQIDSYSIEAQVIGSSQIPPLKESFEVFLKSLQVVWMFSNENIVNGAVFVELSEDETTISKLIVSPTFFRKGVGRNLVEHVLASFRDKDIKVATASKNIPARQLYEKLGFRQVYQQMTPEGIEIVHYLFSHGSQSRNI
jgi:N-acetylglutamate synthase-like GNAT family acetyltransferase